ncbi:MAG: hypothetical protein KGL99_11620 [Burkholderiales bacterium]|nr:hypothetical protein [Burkholderiales bacterium]
MTLTRGTILVTLALLSGGCANLLPRGKTEQPSGFDSFEAAAQAFGKIETYRTTATQLKALGFDLQDGANVTQIPYPQLMVSLAPDRGIPFEALDPGIRDCILARQACRAYEFRLSRESTHRVGNFVLDFLNFRRTTHVSGWNFNGLLAVRDGVVLFRSYGGVPRTDRTDEQVNPLGPLQPAGEAARSLVGR